MATSQDQAIADVGSAFGSDAPGGLTPEQQAAYERVRAAFAPPTAPTTPTSSGSTTSQTNGAAGQTYYPRYTTDAGYSPAAPQTADQIQQQMMQAVQAQINELNNYYGYKLRDQEVVNEGRNRQTSSVSTLSGLAGSSEANIQADKTNALNTRDLDKIHAENAAAIQDILSKVRTNALEEAHKQREEARLDAESQLASRTARQAEAVSQLKNLAAAGVTFDGLKAGDKKSFDYIAAQFGGEEALRGAFVLNTPQDQIHDTKIENGKYIISKQNPITGKISIETVDLGLPTGYSKTIDAGDRILAVPDNWDGDPTKLISINKGLTPDQAHKDGGGSGSDQLYAGLSTQTATAVRSKVTKFGTEPIIQNFATIQDGYNFAKSIKTDTKNPADDQALIYALAKALDPGSVVREGEYNTAQRYAQSWVDAYGKGVTQALAGTGFLSESARTNIKKVIETKYTSSKTSYDQVNRSYTTNINSLTGRSDGAKFLTDYVTQPTVTRSNTISKDGQTFDASALSDEEYQQALSDGYIAQ